MTSDVSISARSDEIAHTTVIAGKHSTWFGPDLLGTVHVPDNGCARGAVVLCAPLGKEQVDTYRGLMLMAQKLCDAGLLVLRFDYHGTGDSHGEQDAAGIVDRWAASVVAAVEYVRACGVEDVALVGLRAGALLSARAIADCGPLAGVALWDPVVRGRAYLHEQRALYSFSVATDDEADPRVSIIGAAFHPSIVAEMAALDSTKLPPFGCPVLVATRAERRDGKAIRTLVAVQNASEHTLSNHEQFLEPSDFEVVMPTPDIAHIATWVEELFTEAYVPVAAQIRTARATTASDGVSIVETLESVGPNHLFAIKTTAPTTPEGGPTLVLYSTANEHRVGPVRMWVELSRSLAAAGITVLRFDRRGTGESGTVLDDEVTRLYSDEGNADALAILDHAGTAQENIVVSGLCSGSWYASYAAQRGDVEAVVLINTLDWTTRRLEFVKRASMVQASTSAVSKAKDALHHWGVRVKNSASTSMPYLLWLWLGRRGLIQVPEISLRRLQDHGVDTTVLLSPHDSEWFVANRGPEGMNRLRRRKAGRPIPVVKSFASGDHTLYGRDLRENIRAELVRAVGAALDVDVQAPGPPVVVDWSTL